MPSAGLGNPEPSRTAHVGDLLRTDIAGARGVGWVSVRYRGLNDDRDRERLLADGMDEADIVVDSHGELPAALGLA